MKPEKKIFDGIKALEKELGERDVLSLKDIKQIEQAQRLKQLREQEESTVKYIEAAHKFLEETRRQIRSLGETHGA